MARTDRHDEIAALRGFQHCYGRERNEFEQHFSLDTTTTQIANSIYAISGTTGEDRNADVIRQLSTLSTEYAITSELQLISNFQVCFSIENLFSHIA